MEAAQKSRQPANDFFGAFPYPISMGGFHSGEELSIRECSFNACDDIFHASIPHIWVVDNRFADVARESLPVEIISVANVVHIVQIAIASTADAVAKEGFQLLCEYLLHRIRQQTDPLLPACDVEAQFILHH